MDDLCFKMCRLCDELRLDPSLDAQFLLTTVSQAIAGIQMRLGNQWGKRMMPFELVEPVAEPERAEMEVIKERVREIMKPKKAPAKKK